MSVREAILMACLAVLGALSFRERSADNRARLASLLRREDAMSRDLLALRQRGRALRLEAEALAHDRYYVERVARADLGWRPSPLRDPGLTPPFEPPSALVQAPAALPPMVPGPLGPPWAPRPPQGPAPAPLPAPPGAAPERVQQALASLGYTSSEHFQARMMGGRADARADAATLARAQQLNELLRRLGYDSVKAFQQRNRLPADGVMGRRTEQRALDLLRRPTPRRAGNVVASASRPRRGG